MRELFVVTALASLPLFPVNQKTKFNVYQGPGNSRTQKPNPDMETYRDWHRIHRRYTQLSRTGHSVTREWDIRQRQAVRVQDSYLFRNENREVG